MSNCTVTGNVCTENYIYTTAISCWGNSKIVSSTITGNQKSYGLRVGSQATLTMGGKVVIQDNERGNLHLDGSQTAHGLITLDTTNPPTDDTNVGISTQTAPITDTPIQITNASGTDYSSRFFSDNDAYRITTSGKTSDSSLKVNLSVQPLFVSKSDSKVYDGTSKKAAITFADDNNTAVALTNDTDYTVAYYYIDDVNGTVTQTPAVNTIAIGRYLYLVTLKSTEQTKPYQFDKKNSTLPTYAGLSQYVTENDNAGILTILGSDNKPTINQEPISFDQGDLEKYVTDGEFNAPVNNPNAGDAKLNAVTSYTSSNEAVATVDSTGKVTIKAVGTAIIKAKSTVLNASDVYASYKLTVKKRPVTVTAKDKTITYGDAPANDGVRYTLINGDTAGGTLSYTYNYKQGGNIGEYTITPSGLESDKYSFTYKSGTLTVNPKTITAENLTASANNKVYDGNAVATGTVSINDGVRYSTDNVKVSYNTARFNDANAAENKTVTFEGLELTGTKAGNYSLTATEKATSATVKIEKMPVTFTVGSTEFVYDSKPHAISVTAEDDNGKKYTGFDVYYTGANGTTYAKSKTVPSAAGDYTVTVALTDSNHKSDDVICGAGITMSILTADEVLTIVGLPETIIYGDTFQLTAHSVSTGAVTWTSSNESVATVDASGNVTIKSGTGSANITATKAAAGNYKKQTASVTVKPAKKAVTVTIADKKGDNAYTYGDALAYTASDLSYSITNAAEINGIGKTSLKFAGYKAGKAVGEYEITASGLTSDNYAFTYVSGALEVKQKVIPASAITASAEDKSYDGTVDAVGTITVNSSAIYDDDNVQVVYNTAKFTSADASDSKQTVTFGGLTLTGTKSDNYKLEETTTTAEASINKMKVTFTFGKSEFAYDGSKKDVTVSAKDEQNRVFSDFTVKYTDAGGDDSETAPTEVSKYTVTAVLGSNYYSSSNTAELTINKGSAIVWATSGTSHKYDGSKKQIQVKSVPNLETEVTYYCITDDGKVGDKETAPTDIGNYLYVITLADVSNYQIADALKGTPTGKVSALTGSNIGIMTIETNVQPDLSFKQSVVTAVYGDEPITQKVIGGASEEESFNVTYSIEDSKGCASINSKTGEVTIKKPGVVLIKATATADGYADETAYYTVAIEKKPVTIQLKEADKSKKVYNGESQTVPYTVSGDESDNRISEEDISFVYTNVADSNDHTHKNTGKYYVTAVIPAENECYTTNGAASGLFEITKADLTVTVDDKTIVYGSAVPSYTVSYEPMGEDAFGCLDGEAKYTCTYQQYSDKGEYDISVDGLTSDNYHITFEKGKLTVLPKVVELAWSSDSFYYNKHKERNVTAAVTNAVNGDEVSVTKYTGNKETDIGTYSAKATALSNSNYTLDATALEQETSAHEWAIITETEHDFSGEWTVTKNATVAEDGRKETLCVHDCGTKKIAVIPSIASAVEDPDVGTLEKDALVAEDAPVKSAELNNTKSELRSILDIANNVNAKVYLTIENVDESTIESDTKAIVNEMAKTALGGDVTAKYMDISLFKQVGENEAERITEAKAPVKITVEIPKELLNSDKKQVRKYRIVCVHGGKAEVVSANFNAKTNEFTFETSKFSTYALIYSDEKIGISITIPNSKAILTKAGETLQLGVTVTPASDVDQTVSYTTSNSKVAKVDKNGKVTACENGTAVITVKTPSGVVKTVTVTVKIPVVITAAQKAENELAMNSGLKVSQSGNSINVSWSKVNGADGYLVYSAYCGSSFGKDIKDVKTIFVKIDKLDGKKLNLMRDYKVYVQAYKLVDGQRIAIGQSITSHVAGSKNKKYTNAKKIELTSKSSVTLKEGKTSTIKAKVVLVSSKKQQLSNAHAQTFRYTSSDTSVATVSSKGKITAKGKGTCYVYVYARNGYAQKVKVTVK